MTTVTYELTDEETKAAQEAVQPYRKLVNETPALLSLLYDLDLMPEQIRMYVNASRLIAVCELFKMVPVDVIETAMKTPKL